MHEAARGDDFADWYGALWLARFSTQGITTDELLEIARSIGPVPADDPRLAAVWQTEFEEE